MRLARLLANFLIVPLKPCRVVSRKGIVWRLDLREAIDLSIYLTGYFQRHVVREIIRVAGEGGVIIDVGANRGAMALPLANLLNNHTVIAVEPVASHVEALLIALQDNRKIAERIRVFRSYLTTPGGEVPKLVDASWNLYADREGSRETPATKLELGGTTGQCLDDLVKTQGLSNIRVIKIDVEGEEPSVLRGAEQTLVDSRPVIIMEWQPHLLRLRGHSVSEFVSRVMSVGYEPYVVRRFRKPRNVSWRNLLSQTSASSGELVLIHASNSEKFGF